MVEGHEVYIDEESYLYGNSDDQEDIDNYLNLNNVYECDYVDGLKIKLKGVNCLFNLDMFRDYYNCKCSDCYTEEIETPEFSLKKMKTFELSDGTTIEADVKPNYGDLTDSKVKFKINKNVGDVDFECNISAKPFKLDESFNANFSATKKF